MDELSQGLFEQNNWANKTLIDACRGLSGDQLKAGVAGTYGSIVDTLVHLVAAQGRYVMRLGGDGGEPIGEDEKNLDRVAEVALETGDALLTLARDTEPSAELQLHFGGKDYSVSAEVVLVQAINHATEHRSQVLTILTQQGVEPPNLDGWTWGSASGRLSERTS